MQQRNSRLRRSPRASWLSRAILAVLLIALILPATVMRVTSGTRSRTSNDIHRSAPAPTSPPIRAAAGQVTPPSTTPSGWTVSYPISLPAGYSEPTGIVSDNAGGLWFFAIGQVSGYTLFHWQTSTESLSSYAIDDSDSTGAPGEWTPLLVDNAGNVWIGIHSTLVEFDPSTGTMNSTDLPPVSVGPPGSGLPSLPPTPGSSDSSTGTDPNATIDSLVPSSTGGIVVGRQFATELQVVDPKTLTVGTIPLPTATALAGLGEGDISSSPSSGVLVAALYAASGAHELGQLVQGSWNVSSTPCPANSTSISNNELVVSGPQCVAAGPLADNTVVALTQIDASGLTATPCVAPISSSVVLACVQGGVAGLNNGTGSAADTPVVSLGEVSAGPSSGFNGVTPTSGLEPIVPTLICAGGVGQAWFVPSDESMIGLVTGPAS
jgi:hypothetical protein